MGVRFSVEPLLRFVSVQHTSNTHEISPRSRTYIGVSVSGVSVSGVSVSGVCVWFHVECRMYFGFSGMSVSVSVSHVFRV